MIKFRLLGISLICLVSLCTGCSSSYSVSKNSLPTTNDNYKEINTKLRGRYVTIEMRDGREYFTNQLNISPDSVLFFNYETNVVAKYNTREVKKIVLNNRVYGFFEGLGIGVIGGGVVGSIIAANDNHSATDGPIGLYLFLISTAVGSGVGAITGLIIGHTYTYEFPYN